MSNAEQMNAISFREHILTSAAALTSQERNRTYGPPTINLGAHGEFISLFRKFCPEGKYCPGHDAAIIQALAKIARIATAPKDAPFHPDHYADGAAYFAIAAECQVDHGAPLKPVQSRLRQEIPPFSANPLSEPSHG